MNGFLSKQGRKYGIPTPINDLLQELVQLRVDLVRRLQPKSHFEVSHL